ncbi:MAG: ComF family protein [Clostridium perfringens]|nr:ComF family protein [Clostridium perfringens]
MSIIYPSSYNCLSCSQELDSIGLCKECEDKIEYCKNIKIIDNINVYSISYYGYSIKKLILDFKYKSNFNCGEYLGELILKKFNEIDEEFDYITCVPSSKNKLKERGFNQCEFLAKYLAENKNISYIESLRKLNKTKEQKLLSAEEREKNIKNAFSLIDNKRLIGKKVLLLDDVITTGFTIEACIRELKKIKSIDLTVIVVAESLN